jgi:hypothetical protein
MLSLAGILFFENEKEFAFGTFVVFTVICMIGVLGLPMMPKLKRWSAINR